MSWIDSVDATPRSHRETKLDQLRAGSRVLRECYSASPGLWGYGIAEDPLTRRSGDAITRGPDRAKRGDHGDRHTGAEKM